MSEDLGTISVSLAVGLGTLDRDLAAIEKKIKPLEREHLIPFAVGKVSFANVQKEIERLTQRAIPVQITVAKGTGAKIHRVLTAQLKAAGPIPVQIRANLVQSEVRRIRTEIQRSLGGITNGLGPIPIRVRAVPVGGGPVGGGPVGGAVPVAPAQRAPALAAPVTPAVASASAAPVAPPPRASTARTAPKTTPPAAPTPTAAAPAPAQPSPPPAARGSSRAQKQAAKQATPVVAPAVEANPFPKRDMKATSKSVRDHHAQMEAWEKAERERIAQDYLNRRNGQAATPEPAAAKTPRAKKAAATPTPTPTPTPPPGGWTFETARKAGNVIDLTGKTEDEVADALGQPTGKQRSVVRRFRKSATGGGPAAPSTPPSMVPETEAEQEYASRPMKVSLPLDEQALAEQEKRGRGARGVGRAGFRRPGERAQTVDEVRQIAKNAKARNARNARERDREIRQPARESEAYYGPNLDQMHPKLRSAVASRQMFKMHSKLGDAYDAWMRGDMETARGELEFLSLEMKGPSGTQQHRRWMRQLRRMERAQPGDVEKDAALGGLFAAIETALDKDAVIKPSADYVPAKRTAQRPRETLPVGAEILGQIPGIDLMRSDLETLSTKDFADFDERHRAERRVVLDHMHRQGIRDLKPGQRIKQADAVLKALKEIGPEGRELGGDVRALPVFGRGRTDASPKEWGEIGEQARSSSGLPFELRRVRTADIEPWHGVQPELIEKYKKMVASGSPLPPVILGPGGRIQDGHHRLETARQMGIEDLLAYVFSGDASALPEGLAKQLGVKREQGGPVEGALMRAIRLAKERKEQEGQYLVGEKRPEVFRDMRGNTEIIGEDGPEVRSFDRDGTVIPFVPAWVRRQKQNAKDFTGRETGGGVKKKPKAAPQFKGRLMAEPESGLIGRGKTFRVGVPGEKEAIAAGELSSKGGVQRVFVTNWPAGGMMAGRRPMRSMPGDMGMAAGPEAGLGDPMEGLLARMAKIMRPARARKTDGGEPKKEKEEVEPNPRLTAAERLQSKFEAFRSVEENREMLSGLRARHPETRSFSPVRSTGPAFGQIVGTLLGRGELIKRLQVASDLTNTALKYDKELEHSKAKEADIQKQIDRAQSPKKIAELTQSLVEQKEASSVASEKLAEWTNKAQAATEHADAFSLKLGTMIGNTAGIAVGTLMFGATLGVLQAGLAAVSAVAAPLVERMTGYQNVTAAVTKGLAEQTRQAGGAVEATVALATANARLGSSISDTVSPLLQQRAATEAGNLAIQDAVGLVASAITVRKQNAQIGGIDKGIVAGTGGWFGTSLGAIPSTQEQFVNLLGQNQQSLGSFKAQASAASPLSAGSQWSDAGSAWFQAANAGNPLLTGVAPEDLAGELADRFAASLETASTYVELFQSAIDKAGGKFQIDVAKASESTADLARREVDAAKSAKAFADAGLLDTAKELERSGTIIRDVNGQLIQSADQAREFYADINRGFQTPSVEALLKQMSDRIIPAQKALFRAEGQFQRGVSLPSQTALSQIANPTPGLTGGPAFEAGLVGIDQKGKTDAAARSAAATYKAQVGGAIEDINAEIAKGREAMMNLVPNDLRGEFGGILSDIESLGKQISGIQIGLQQQQVNLQVAEYNNQLRIARRSLQDAKDLQQGIAGATKDTLGGIEGQTIALQRQLQLLQFELQQRQINFKLATAGFVAPGTTPEERAARIAAAVKEAEYAQKQLDIQKKLADLSYKGITISADRSVTDLVAQIGLLEQGREVTLNTAAASRALEILGKRQQQLVDKAGTYLEEGTKIATTIMRVTSQIQQETGEAFGTILGQTAKAWGIFGAQAALIMAALTGSSPKANPATTAKPYASGIVGDTLGPTQITVGEAAGEKVAVLKNPKIVPTANLGGALGGGYGGGGPLVNMTVIITGNSIREEGDLASLAEMVARKVEDRLMQKTSLFSMRRA